VSQSRRVSSGSRAPQEETTVHGQGHARNVGSLVRAQKQNGPRPVLWRADVVQRQLRDHRFQRDGVRTFEILLDHVGHEQRRGDLVDADAQFARFPGCRLREMRDRTLAHAVETLGCCRTEPSPGTNAGIRYDLGTCRRGVRRGVRTKRRWKVQAGRGVNLAIEYPKVGVEWAELPTSTPHQYSSP
jgi:hypothetical protein